MVDSGQSWDLMALPSVEIPFLAKLGSLGFNFITTIGRFLYITPPLFSLVRISIVRPLIFLLSEV